MGITTLDVVLPNPDKISEFKDPLLQWEKVDNARTPSWRQDLLLEVEPEEEELDHWQWDSTVMVVWQL